MLNESFSVIFKHREFRVIMKSCEEEASDCWALAALENECGMTENRHEMASWNMNLISHLLPLVASGVDDFVEEKLCLPPKIETEGQDTVILYLFFVSEVRINFDSLSGFYFR